VEHWQSPTRGLRSRALIGTVLVVGTLAGCNATLPLATITDPLLPRPPALEAAVAPQPQTDLLTIAQSIPENASKQQMDEAINLFMRELFEVRSGDMQQVMAAIAVLHDQPAVVASLIDYYDSIPAPVYEKRMMTIGFIGELQRPDAMPFFFRMIWAPLRLRQPIVEGPTPRELIEMLRIKAVHGLAYLHTVEADAAVLDIMRRHESTAIRIAAIDAYMWNHGDTEETAQQLYIILPVELHMYVERPRFHRGMDRAAFNAQLRDWQNRWARPRRSQ